MWKKSQQNKTAKQKRPSQEEISWIRNHLPKYWKAFIFSESSVIVVTKEEYSFGENVPNFSDWIWWFEGSLNLFLLGRRT